jgi:hypothetical protein
LGNSLSGRRFCLCISLIFTLSFIAFSGAAQLDLKPKAKIVTIPLSIVDVDEATATISVLEEPLSSFNAFLKNCQSSLPEDFQKEDKDFSDDLKKFCEITEQFAKRYLPPPTQHLEPKGYVITVPLKSPYQRIEALLWTTKSLDDAISFVSLLQGGHLKAIKVYTTIPWEFDPTRTCTECPIKELVFSAKGIKEHLQELKKKEGQ